MEVSDFIMILLVVMSFMFIVFIIGMCSPSLVIRWGNVEKRNRKKVFLVYGLGTLCLYVFIQLFSYYYMNNISNNKASKSYQTKSSNVSKEVISTSPKEIYDEFDNNKISAKNKYKDKIVSITGKIYVITEDGGTPSIGLVNSDDNFKVTIPNVYCSFADNKQNDKIMKLSKGQVVTIEGILDMAGTSIFIKNCTLK